MFPVGALPILVSCGAPSAPPEVPQKPQVEIAKGLRRSGYLAEIDALSKRAGLPDLRTMPIARGDEEIRVWTF